MQLLSLVALAVLASHGLTGGAEAKKLPLVILPSSFRWNSTNTITVTPLKLIRSNEVDSEFRVEDSTGVIYAREDLIWKAGVANSKHFFLSAPSSNPSALPHELKLRLTLKEHESFETTVKTSTDLRVVHVYSDKAHYRSGETVTIRALPLDFYNQMYTKPIEFVLINPGRFELLRRRSSSINGRFVQARMKLPQHLQHGEWRIEARAVESHEAAGTVYFNVHDYVLPNFELAISVDQETTDITHVPVTVKARYTHTVLVEGGLNIYCFNRTHSILQDTEFMKGEWSGLLNLSSCGGDRSDPTQMDKPITVIAMLRDKGAGTVGEATDIYDPTEPRFDLVPLRPAVGERTGRIKLLSVGSGGSPGAQLNVSATCLLSNGGRENGVPRQLVRVGETITIIVPNAWMADNKKKCTVVAIQAARILKDGSESRRRTLLLPVISARNHLSLSWIDPIKGLYKAGEQINTRVDTQGRDQPNYVVHCNGRHQAASGTLSGPVAPLAITVTPEMKGVCIIAVYTAQGQIEADVHMFVVEESCTHTVLPIGGATKPGAEIAVQLDSKGEGIALLSAIDDRLNWISDKPRTWTDLLPSKFWSHPSPTDSINATANLINYAEIEKEITNQCKLAGKAYYYEYKSCPETIATSSPFSDTCLRHLYGPCKRTMNALPDASPNCGKHGTCTTTARPPSVSGGYAGDIQEVYTLKTGAIWPVSRFTAKVPENDVPFLKEKGTFETRKKLPHVWIFEDYEIPARGRLRLNYRLPDTVGRWSMISSFWAKGDHDLCLAPEAFVDVHKQYFVQANVPASAYLNETVAVEIIVSGDYVEDDVSLVICQAMDRSVCSDMGVNGQKGEAVFSRIELSPSTPIVTKTIAMRFLATGSHNVTFTLRKEEHYPGRYHCDGGDVMDAVQHTVVVQKRAETEEHYRGLILTVDKPVIDSTVFDGFNAKKPVIDIIQVREYRESGRPGTLMTEITTPLKSTDQISTFSIEISKFLPLPQVDFEDAQDVGGRRKRSAQQLSSSSSAFLTDVLQQLALHIFKQEQLRAVSTTPIGALEALDNAISSAVSDMLRFTDCDGHSQDYCGFANEGKPASNSSYSVFLTSMSASLLCKASADPQLVCGALGFLHSRLGPSSATILKLDRELNDALQFRTHTDRLFFTSYMLAQAAHDCEMYACLATGTAKHSWEQLYITFYKFDDKTELDGRTVAALATLSTPATKKRMRGQLSLDIQSGDIAPFWSARTPDSPDGGMQKSGRTKAGDVLINSLALIAFVDNQREVPMNFDLLADWIDEQRGVDELYGNVVDTFFASRAISTYRLRKGLTEAEENSIQVEIRCAGCPQMLVNVTDSAPLFYIPTNVRNLTILTTGRGKARAGVRILSAKKQRQRRGNVNAITYPVEITVDQVIYKNGQRQRTLTQVVCLKPTHPRVKYVEITHGIYTGYTTQPHHFELLNATNSSMVVPVVLQQPFISTYAVHFVLAGLVKGNLSCYQLGLMEPTMAHEPDQLAPVAISVRDASNGIIGESLVIHPDARNRRIKRSINLVMPDRQQVVVYDYVPRSRGAIAGTSSPPFLTTLRRARRSSLSDPIEAVCFPGGQCTCAERSCNVNCGACRVDESKYVKQDVCEYGAFAATVEVASVANTQLDGAEFILAELNVLHWSSRELGKPASLTVWLRPCAFLCGQKLTDHQGSTFIFIGEAGAVVPDENGRLNYVLRDWDRFIKADEKCSAVLTAVVVNKC